MKKYLIIIAVGALALTACKPTEKNYRSAYDAAISKRQAEHDALEADGLIAEDAPRPIYMDGDTLYFANEIIEIDTDFAPLKNGNANDSQAPSLKALNVAVGVFKMNTNARSGASALREKGFDAFPVKSLGDKWYIIAGSGANLDEARAIIKDFKKKNPDYPFIGLGGHPVIIRK